MRHYDAQATRERNFGLDDIWHMVDIIYVDELSRLSCREGDRAQRQRMQCNNFKGVRHLIQDCTTCKKKEHWHGTNPHASLARHGMGGEQAQLKGDGKKKWCLFREAITHTDQEGRIQIRKKTENERGNCAAHLCSPTVLSVRGPPPSCKLNRSCILFAAVEALTRTTPAEEEGF